MGNWKPGTDVMRVMAYLVSATRAESPFGLWKEGAGVKMEIITRTERRRRWSDVEREAILADAEVPGATVKAVARRHGVAESLVYGWRKARREAEAIAAEPMRFIAYGALDEPQPSPPMTVVMPSAPAPAPRPVRKPVVPSPSDDSPALDELVRPHPGSRPGSIDIALRTGVRLSVDSYVNERALTRVLRALKAVV